MANDSNSNPQVAQTALEQQLPYIALQPDPLRSGLFCLARPPAVVPRGVYQPPKCRRNNNNNNSNGNHFQNERNVRHGNAVGDEADRSAGDTTPRQQQLQYQSNNNHDNNNDDDWARPNQHSDEVLVLFTSGTTGQKKLVPHLLQDVLVATACISVSWKLTAHDTNCNLMPLFHVGGIIRQVYSPILSGGCVICCPAFDPATFWSLAGQFTWYYAAPTMHQLILQQGKAEGHVKDDGSCHPTMQLRMIANAAGGLLPSMARELRQAFSANILPSYGMTECMPITSPPATYLLEKPGTSGVAVGPEICILNAATGRPMQVAGKEGPICVRGEPCFRGYGRLADDHTVDDNNNDNASKKDNSFLKGGWFDTVRSANELF